MPFAAIWMDQNIMILRSKSERKRKIPYDTTYMRNLIKNDTSELIYKKKYRFSDLEIKLIVIKGKPLGEGIN